MIHPSVVHQTIVLERTYPASPARVFAAWADPDVKARWFIGPEDWRPVRRELDFRNGGHELLHGVFPSGRETLFAALYHQIVRDRRIVYAYDMHVDDKYLSVSLVTVEIEPSGPGARLVFTEQVAFLDGIDGKASRERGNAAHLDRLGHSLGSTS